MFDIVKWGNRFDYFAFFRIACIERNAKNFEFRNPFREMFAFFRVKISYVRNKNVAMSHVFFLTEFRIFLLHFGGGRWYSE